jgi:hypothetical protein
VVSFTPRPLYPQGKSPRYTLDSNSVISDSPNPEPVWREWRRQNSCPYRDSNSDPLAVQPVASRYTDSFSYFMEEKAFPLKTTTTRLPPRRTSDSRKGVSSYRSPGSREGVGCAFGSCGRICAVNCKRYHIPA